MDSEKSIYLAVKNITSCAALQDLAQMSQHLQGDAKDIPAVLPTIKSGKLVVVLKGPEQFTLTL